ncbi:MAG: hypothetical protein IPP72_07400 [Chitinophagaceae bacterium]|nr:hypothetical protein [Chitinophagaceae bacterium]
MSKCILIAFFFFNSALVAAQNKVLPEEAKRFLISGYEMLDYITGDLNGDKKQDAILIIKKIGEDTTYEETKRPFMLLARQADGKLKQVKRNDNVILCRHCGGAFGDPYEYVDITNKGFGIHFYGGSSWRWASTYSFQYNAARANWYLTSEKQVSYHNTDMDLTMKEVNIDAVELGIKSIDSFNGNPRLTRYKWEVVAAKTFFYNNPKTGSKPRKGYLVKGDTVTSYRELTHFVDVYFENNKEQSSSGFVLKKNLVKIE